MEYRILIDEFKKNYKIDETSTEQVKLQHNTGNTIVLLPFVTNFKKENKDYIINFSVVLGELSRLLTDKKIKGKFSKEILINKLIEKVNFDNEQKKSSFIDIINNLFFDNNDNLQIFHPKVCNYITAEKSYVHKKIGQFIFNVLSSGETKEILKDKFYTKPQNLLYKLMLESLPDLNEESSKFEPNKYKVYTPFISKLFQKDLKTMIEDTRFFVDDFEKLIKYYYFFYVSQLILKLNEMFDADVSCANELYFNLDTESTSRTRTSYMKGWEVLKGNWKVLFPHINCLEILNHRRNESKGPYSYLELKKIICELDNQELIALDEEIKEIIKLYKFCIGDVVWEEMNPVEGKYSNPVLNRIYELYKSIYFQFTLQRTERCKNYFEWFEEFCKANFLKIRGQLGYTLNITEEYLVFITKLCIPKGDKLRLNLLFKEFEHRGIWFDRDSKYKIVEIYEKLNILEKKSDSGDAQYVKSIL